MSREKWKKQRSFTKNSWKSYTNRVFLAVLTRFWRRKVENKKTWSELQVFLLWRRVRDLNPRTAHHRYTISSRAPSTTQPTLHMVAEEGFEPSQTESESVVLPLHNPAICTRFFRRKWYYSKIYGVVKPFLKRITKRTKKSTDPSCNSQILVLQ